MAKIYAPFTTEQVEGLNRYQANPHVHPFTCGGDRKDEKHLDGEGKLLATPEGWICPYCPDGVQDWAHDFMVQSKDQPTLEQWAQFFGE